MMIVRDCKAFAAPPGYCFSLHSSLLSITGAIISFELLRLKDI
jgi:hypothetical protein